MQATWKSVRVCEQHERCCAAAATGDADAELRALTELHDLFKGTKKEAFFARHIELLRSDLGLPPVPGPLPAASDARGTGRPSNAHTVRDRDADPQDSAARQRQRIDNRPEVAPATVPAPTSTAVAPQPAERKQAVVPTYPQRHTHADGQGAFLAPVVPTAVFAAPAPLPQWRRQSVAATLPPPAGGPGGAQMLRTAAEEEEADDDVDMPSASQASQGDEDDKCCICLQTLFMPIRHAACNNHMCYPCYLQGIEAAGGTRTDPTVPSRKCPLCRAPISAGEAHAARVDEERWAGIQARHPPHAFAARRRALHAEGKLPKAQGTQSHGSAPSAAGLAISDGPDADRLQVERVRREMTDHRLLLHEAARDYFTLLDGELRKPVREIFRCRCKPRFVMIRRIASDKAKNPGRPYYACPLRQPGVHAGCGAYEDNVL